MNTVWLELLWFPSIFQAGATGDNVRTRSRGFTLLITKALELTK
jgi:hypothetical protein